jgi:hypothetical protein
MSVVNDQNRNRLEQNPNVKSVSSSNISYTSEFRKSALQQYEAGVSRRLIWINAGFNPDDFLPDYFRKVLKRWQQQALKAGDSDWTKESRGVKTKRAFSSEREELEYLRAENKLLKEIRALGSNSK